MRMRPPLKIYCQQKPLAVSLRMMQQPHLEQRSSHLVTKSLSEGNIGAKWMMGAEAAAYQYSIEEEQTFINSRMEWDNSGHMETALPLQHYQPSTFTSPECDCSYNWDLESLCCPKHLSESLVTGPAAITIVTIQGPAMTNTSHFFEHTILLTGPKQ
ncbi:uncharacterized protein [Hetaerina americana]|uniref:uncharacterized protein isoform X2 n=1 Tax=Hetaerina americana TaxID=62018 RepID=UPI003A7F5956